MTVCSKDIFCLHGNAAECKVSLKEVVLFVHKVKANSSIQLAHTKALQLAIAKYPLRRVEEKVLPYQWEIEVLPKKICFWSIAYTNCGQCNGQRRL